MFLYFSTRNRRSLSSMICIERGVPRTIHKISILQSALFLKNFPSSFSIAGNLVPDEPKVKRENKDKRIKGLGVEDNH